ncbi:hypothetical protein KCP77_20235 [Salmonella enterica subsp. enterica]|nr:hypothetical protein KCP77_20235 [Salmonella enterica subsp. enterica]
MLFVDVFRQKRQHLAHWHNADCEIANDAPIFIPPYYFFVVIPGTVTHAHRATAAPSKSLCESVAADEQRIV